MIPPDDRRFWSTAASFGALWGALEVTVGSFAHALHLPFSGALLGGVAAGLLVAQRQLCPTRGLSLATALVAALLKGFSPAGAILGPMVAIAMEGLLVELVLLPRPTARLSAAAAGAMTVIWSLTQKILMQVVLYGRDIVRLLIEAVERAAASVGASPDHAWSALAVLATLLVAIGTILGLYGHWVGRRAAEVIGATTASSPGEAT